MTKVVLEFPISSCLLAVVSDMFLCSLRMFRNMTRECAKVSGSDTPGISMAAHAGNSQAEHCDRGVFLSCLPKSERLHRRGQGKDTHTKKKK